MRYGIDIWTVNGSFLQLGVFSEALELSQSGFNQNKPAEQDELFDVDAMHFWYVNKQNQSILLGQKQKSKMDQVNWSLHYWNQFWSVSDSTGQAEADHPCAMENIPAIPGNGRGENDGDFVALWERSR